jgi:hypothetical protein
MPVTDDTKAIVAAILAASRIARHGIDRGAVTRKAYVDEFLRMLQQLNNPDQQERDHVAPDPL